MLKPPSDYKLTTVPLTSHSAKIENLVFDTAVIFFVPKVANKGVDLSTLSCTIVQIIDRGEWGKEEVPFTVDASSFSNRKHREFDLTADAEYSLKIIPPSELRMGILEIYFDPTTHHNMASTNNPVNVITDMSPVVAAINAGSAAQIAAAQTIATSPGMTAKRLVEIAYTPLPWSKASKNHIAVTPDPTRIGGSFYNSTKSPIAVDQYLDIGAKTNNLQTDTIVQPGGTYDLNTIDAAMGLLLYTLDGSSPPAININLLYPQPAAPTLVNPN